MSETAQRPSKEDKQVLEAIADVLVPKVKEWFQKEESDDSGVREDIIEMLEGSSHEDGYERARYLERYCYWSPDSELVEILDSVSHMVYNCHRKIVVKWAEDNSIKPAHMIGDEIIFGRDNEKGTIVGIRDDATYLIKPEIEHEFNGMPIVNFEDVKSK